MKKLLLLLFIIPAVCFSSGYRFVLHDPTIDAQSLLNGYTAQTCRNCYVMNNVLTCLCLSRKGIPKFTSLDLSTNYKNLPYIINHNGNLQFSSNNEDKSE